ncbi:hypothetical protein JY438_00275 [Stenotrophomonas maltophilia]|nr:hypothetical protein [Stenotrophomonas maltophilia]
MTIDASVSWGQDLRGFRSARSFALLAHLIERHALADLPGKLLDGAFLFFHGCVSCDPQDTACGKQQSAAA